MMRGPSPAGQDGDELLTSRGVSERHRERPELSGAQEFPITKGDVLHVPARSWHQVKVAEGDSITYALINVFEE